MVLGINQIIDGKVTIRSYIYTQQINQFSRILFF